MPLKPKSSDLPHDLPSDLRDEFARSMAALGPFESQPRLAIAVSGGADSLALCFLAHDWCAARGGWVHGLTVDHGLRAESAEEARRVGRWLAAQSIDHRILRWRGEKPEHGIQAAARAARYDLMSGWCRRNGVLHLLTGHHLDDQAETFLFRLARGSGAQGLAAMAPLRTLHTIRLLRPLLNSPKRALTAFLDQTDQAWIEDPSNDDPRYARARLRTALRGLSEAGLTSSAFARGAAAFAGLNATVARRQLDLLIRGVRISPLGFCRLDVDLLARQHQSDRIAVLRRILMCIGGATYPPGAKALDNLAARLFSADFSGATLSRCRILNWRGELYVIRENRHLPSPIEISGSNSKRRPRLLRWDRFVFHVPGGRALPRDLCIAPLGVRGYRQLGDQPYRQVGGRSQLERLPAALRPSLPALWQGGTPLWLPILYGNIDFPKIPDISEISNFQEKLVEFQSISGIVGYFSPTHPLTAPDGRRQLLAH